MVKTLNMCVFFSISFSLIGMQMPGASLFSLGDRQAAQEAERKAAWAQGRTYFVSGEWVTPEIAALPKQSLLERFVLATAACLERASATEAVHKAAVFGRQKSLSKTFGKRSCLSKLAAQASLIVGYFERAAIAEKVYRQAAWAKGLRYNFNGRWMNKREYDQCYDACARSLLDI